MKIGDVKNIKIAKKYSNALIGMSFDNDMGDKVYNDLVFIVETINSNNELKDFLYSPVFKNEDKKDVLSKLFAAHIEKISLDFLYILVDEGRLNIINEVLNQYSDSLNQLNNITKPIITSAVELNEEQKNTIIKKLEDKLSTKILPEYQVNPDIIGGLILEIGDKTVDCSLKTKFDNMQKELTKGNRYGNN